MPLIARLRFTAYDDDYLNTSPAEDLSDSQRGSPSESPSNGFADDSQRLPFETGRMVLSLTGSLHLLSTATFYRPPYIEPDWLKDLIQQPHIPIEGYLAPYLPFPMSKDHHSALLDLCFETVGSFGLNYFKPRFVDAMEQNVNSPGMWFSPLLHLAVLAIGWRYCLDKQLSAAYRPSSFHECRGQDFVQKAHEILLDELKSPCLSTIRALALLSLWHVGMYNE